MERFGVKDKVVLITGGTRGIGFALAKGFSEVGAKVWIHGSDKERTREIAEKNGWNWIYGDLTEPDRIDFYLNPFLEQEDKLDVLINNAGFESHSMIGDEVSGEWDNIYHVNAKSPYLFVNKLLTVLRSAKGASIINVTSIHQTVPVKGNGHYCMAKASLAMFTKVAALELAKDQIRVNNLAPGAILTDMNRELIQELDFESWIPLGRVGETEELIGPAIFLASQASSYITGTTLYVDGGYTENLLRY